MALLQLWTESVVNQLCGFSMFWKHVAPLAQLQMRGLKVAAQASTQCRRCVHAHVSDLVKLSGP
jgi:hypothetical protein